MLGKLEFHYYLKRIRGTLLKDRYTYLIKSRTFLLRMRNV